MNARYESAKEVYAKLGIDTEAALAKLQNTRISMHCWQADDVHGFEGTGALSGIISNSGLKDVIISFIETLGLPGFMLAPISGMLMGAATASATAGTTLASQIFGPTVVASGVTPLAAAAMTHASCFVFDGLPHGSFFHVSAGGVNMEISERLKLLVYEAINGLAMMAASTLVFGVLKLAG